MLQIKLWFIQIKAFLKIAKMANVRLPVHCALFYQGPLEPSGTLWNPLEPSGALYIPIT